MKTAIFVEEKAVQLVLKPETDFEATALDRLHKAYPRTYISEFVRTGQDFVYQKTEFRHGWVPYENANIKIGDSLIIPMPDPPSE